MAQKRPKMAHFHPKIYPTPGELIRPGTDPNNLENDLLERW